MTSNPTITILHRTAFPCASAEPEKARVNRPGRGVGGGLRLRGAGETTCRSTNRTAAETAACAESNQEEGVEKEEEEEKEEEWNREPEAGRTTCAWGTEAAGKQSAGAEDRDLSVPEKSRLGR